MPFKLTQLAKLDLAFSDQIYMQVYIFLAKMGIFSVERIFRKTEVLLKVLFVHC